MGTVRIAIVSFPGSNGEVESMRVIRRVGMEPVFFRWNDDRATLKDIDGYFIPGGFSYEDRGRSGMVAARDPLMDTIGAEADAGKVVIGICNGAQVLVESGLVPSGDGLRMSLARNAIQTERGMETLPLLSEWVWMTRSCAKDRCATSGWDEVMQVPIAHGEGRFTTLDTELIEELQENDQIAFSYSDAGGTVRDDPTTTPNGSVLAIAGICNPAGNVVALMPHPERAQGGGDAYFASMREWIERRRRTAAPSEKRRKKSGRMPGFRTLPIHAAKGVEIFIETIITNNEERTVEQAARRVAPALRLKQWKYLSVQVSAVEQVLADLTVFNANKERAFIKKGSEGAQFIGRRTVLIRRDIPDAGSSLCGEGTQTGTAYGIEGISEQEMCSEKLLEVFANPHAGTLERITV